MLILVGLLLLAVPVFQRYVLGEDYHFVTLGFSMLAIFLFLLGFWRINQNLRYTFFVRNYVVQQQFSGNKNSNFSVNLRDIEAVKSQQGKKNSTFYLVLSSGKRYPIPNTMNNKPEKIARFINTLTGA